MRKKVSWNCFTGCIVAEKVVLIRGALFAAVDYWYMYIIYILVVLAVAVAAGVLAAIVVWCRRRRRSRSSALCSAIRNGGGAGGGPESKSLSSHPGSLLSISSTMSSRSTAPLIQVYMVGGDVIQVYMVSSRCT